MRPEVETLGELAVGVEPGLITSQGLVGVLEQRPGLVFGQRVDDVKQGPADQWRLGVA